MEENLDLIEFADVIVPVKVPQCYTYQIPHKLKGKVSKGSRVIVEFGRKKIITAIVHLVHEHPPKVYKAKPILELLDEQALINSYQFELMNFVSQYYMCTMGEVVNVALPAGFKISSESKIQLHPSYESEYKTLSFSEEEIKLLDYISKHPSVSFENISINLEIINLNTLIKSLVREGVLLVFEEIKEKYSPKFVKKIKLSNSINSIQAIEKLMKDLEKKTAQIEAIQHYLVLNNTIQHWANNQQGIDYSVLSGRLNSQSPLNTLVKNGVMEEFCVVVPRFELSEETSPLPTLSNLQYQCLADIEKSFEGNKPVLLHGITGSGKTELYVQLIHKALQGESQVLLLMPEIALTTQLVNRLQKYFGKQLGVYHSKFSDNERVEVWTGILSGRLKVIIGVRSAIFLPFDNLGLVIVDEEHDSSYKQSDPAPRYHGKDVALMLAKIHHARILLGSATPSLESYYLCQSKHWDLVKLKQRYGNAELPEVARVDMAYEQKHKNVKLGFSHQLLEHLKKNKSQGMQSLVFHNRRGYAPQLVCEDCGFVSGCDHCNVSLTYHQYKASLICHYCGYTEQIPSCCPACGSTRLVTKGSGTEKIEENLSLALPECKIDRMDADSTKSKHGYQKIITALEQGDTDILVGTQMLSKGFDFAKVNLVQIPEFDRMLQFPDFRAHERTFQLISQVSGRAGRRAEKGLVQIQSYKPKHWLLDYISKHDYEGFYEIEIAERKKFLYPPFTRLISITVKNTDQKKAENTAQELHALLSSKLGTKHTLGPEAPTINKIKNYYLQKILIKIDRNKQNLSLSKEFISKCIFEITTSKIHRTSIIQIDVDPA
jgi:primosomal protein N' (replication factor Y)